jgi:membrane-associated phospholipid phosphatase
VLYGGIASPGFHSFPSGHTSKTMATYGFLALIWFTASRSALERMVIVLTLLFISTVVPLGRMSMGVHWPSDVVAGMLLGITWVAVLGVARRYEGQAAPLAAAETASASRVAR